MIDICLSLEYVGYKYFFCLSFNCLGYRRIGNVIGFSPRKYDIYPLHLSLIISLPRSCNTPFMSNTSFLSMMGLLSFNNIILSIQMISVDLLYIGVAVNKTSLKL